MAAPGTGVTGSKGDLKMMLLLFYYDIPVADSCMAQIGERLDFSLVFGF